MDQTPLVNLPDDFRRLVCILPEGESDAITSGELAERLHREEEDPTNYQLRKAIKSLITDHGWPIGSCSDGYYLIQSNHELESNLEELRGRKHGIQQRIRALRDAWRAEQGTDDTGQGRLF